MKPLQSLNMSLVLPSTHAVHFSMILMSVGRFLLLLYSVRLNVFYEYVALFRAKQVRMPFDYISPEWGNLGGPDGASILCL